MEALLGQRFAYRKYLVVITYTILAFKLAHILSKAWLWFPLLMEIFGLPVNSNYVKKMYGVSQKQWNSCNCKKSREQVPVFYYLLLNDFTFILKILFFPIFLTGTSIFFYIVSNASHIIWLKSNRRMSFMFFTNRQKVFANFVVFDVTITLPSINWKYF